MIKPKCRLGTVSWPPNHQACYVRVSIPGEDGISLSLKATFNGFSRHDLEKGDVVEVARSDPRDARRYRVLRLFKLAEAEGATSIGVTISDIKKNVIRAWSGGVRIHPTPTPTPTTRRIRL